VIPRVIHVTGDTGLFGGKDRVLLWLLVELAERELADPVLVCFQNGLVARKYRDAGVSVEILSMSNPFDISAVPRLARLINKHRASVVHTHDHKSHVLGRLASRLQRTHIVSTLHGLLSDAKEIPPFRRELYGLIVRLTDPLTERWIAVSRPLYRRLEQTGRARYIPNAVDPRMVAQENGKALVPDDDGTVILCLGRLSREKGQDVLLDAMKEVLASRSEATLWLAGEGPSEPMLRAQASRLGIEQRVRFLGFSEYVAPLLRRATILALPSRGEGMPISALEAMSLGVPVVATGVGGVPDLLSSPDVGSIIPPENPLRLANALVDLLNNPERATAVGRAGREHVLAHFTLSKMATDTALVYQECLGDS
jgi:glycosyltransferase involved in cell wall biosynthesis